MWNKIQYGYTIVITLLLCTVNDLKKRKREKEKSTANKIMDKITLFIVATLMLFNGIQGNKRNKMHLRLLLFVLSYLENILLWKRGLILFFCVVIFCLKRKTFFKNEFKDIWYESGMSEGSKKCYYKIWNIMLEGIRNSLYENNF